ncbi:hypothetical protein H0I23_08025 [Cellulophaga sp. HaHaR_3_176]|uniref:hypothetical protein n=1 Tax=Cellulophaga sp. HaHaR_3_176 TaxID=1942464 RepID=UPI001C1F20A0|nr:hypothetical protein [Cellulophaga sp. HaHaR_3_176]QWX85574.1 hypothetical protein H0I23_08025 [Cellulophaga sp. HaHaR_3_176]
MKKITFLPLLALTVLFTACSKDDDAVSIEEDHETHENISLLISDTNSPTLNFINLDSEEVKTYQASYAKGSIYATESGRYGVITHRDNNFTETFNIGGEIDHGDHSHDLGETGFAAVKFESSEPTHFKSEQDYVAIYNDGDATLSLFNEKTIETNELVKSISTGTTAHHGAMVIFRNGNIAVTNLGNGAVLPEKVHIINQEGEIVSQEEQSLSTSGIHGSAGNNTTALFGSNTGVLVVNDTGEQKIISYPTNFEDNEWFGSILATNSSNIFVGYTTSKGAYFIDIDSEEISPIHETTDLFKCIVSRDKKEVLSLTKNGDFKVTDVASKAVIYADQVPVPMDTESTDHDSVISNIDYFDNSLYISIPSEEKIIQYNLEEMVLTKEFQLAITPYQFTILAYDIEH